MKVEVEEAVVIDETVDIQQLLSFVNPQELSQFIYEYATMHPEFKTALLNRFMAKELSATSKEKDYRVEIQKVFNDSYYNKSLVIIIVMMILTVIGKLFSIGWTLFWRKQTSF